MSAIHFVRLIRPKKSAVYDKYWQFAVKRNEIFEKRIIDRNGPWTEDEILKHNRFTNVFRASDRVSQFLIKLQYQGDNVIDVFFKTMLFKIFNKIETYAFLEREVGNISCSSFDLKLYDELLTSRLVANDTIYSGAYIMPSPGNVFGYKLKHSNHLALIKSMLDHKLYEQITESKSLEDVYKVLLNCPSFGSFLAYQYTIDLNYSEIVNFSEMDFVVAGPGAKNGISKCFESFGDFQYEDIIKLMTDEQELECERLELKLPNLWGRRLQLIDCQNLFCEVDKYLRGTNPDLKNNSGRTRIKQKFKKSKGFQVFFFPPKWKINEKINSTWSKANEDIFS